MSSTDSTKTQENFRRCLDSIRRTSEFFLVHNQHAFKVRVATDFYQSEYYDGLGVGYAAFCLVGAHKEVQEALDWLEPRILNGKRTENGFLIIVDKKDIDAEHPKIFTLK